jgi:hypothetical protein
MTAQNVLGMAVKSVYLNEPMNKQPDPDVTDPLTPPESGTPTSENLTEQEKTYKKRYDDIKLYNDKIVEDNKALKAQLTELTVKKADEQLNSPKFPKTAEEYKQFKADYPELAANMETAAMTVASSQSQALNDKLKQLEEVQNAIRSREGVAELTRLHPDFEEIKDDTKFHEWFKHQIPEIQALIQSPSPRVISEGLNKYKSDTGIKSKSEVNKNLTREIKATQRVQIGEGQKRTYKDSEISKMHITEFAKLEADILLAQQEGRYLYGQ